MNKQPKTSIRSFTQAGLLGIESEPGPGNPLRRRIYADRCTARLNTNPVPHCRQRMECSPPYSQTRYPFLSWR